MPFFPVLGIMTVVFALMALALLFSKYKKRESGCCGGIHCDEKKTHSCYAEKKEFVKRYSSLNNL